VKGALRLRPKNFWKKFYQNSCALRARAKGALRLRPNCRCGGEAYVLPDGR